VKLGEYLRILRTRWRLFAFCILVSMGAAAGLSIVQTPKYEASTQLFVAGSSNDIANAYTGQLFSQQRVQSYVRIINSPQVADAVVQELGLSISSSAVASEISADAPPNTVLLNVHVTDTQPGRAQAIANAVSAQFATLAGQLETPAGSSTSPVKVSVVKSAALPTTPVSPKTRRNIILGALLGLLAGAGAVVLRETLDTSVKHLDELTEDIGVPPMGVVLYDADAVKRPLLIESQSQSSRAEAFRQLRTNLQFVDVDQAPRSIVVTSSVPEEGKSTTTANLAISLANAGVNVCLIEGDLRRPRLMQYLGLERAAGLTNVLIGRASLDDVLQPWGSGKLHVLGGGPTPPNPSELLGARSMADLLHELESRFDLVIIDAPPLLPVTDAAVLASLTSGVLLVVRYGRTKREQVRRAVEALRAVDASIYGIVLNMAPAKGPDAYYYGYAYRYDYKAAQTVDLKPATFRPRAEPVGSQEPAREVGTPGTVRIQPAGSPAGSTLPPGSPTNPTGPYYPATPSGSDR
jgi:capsular exopolysaccharide synthesis family protein